MQFFNKLGFNLSTIIHLQDFSFADIQINSSLNTITKNGRTKRLEPKLILLLNYFALNTNRVIPREELHENLWSDVVVSDEVITRAIFALRNALGDNAKKPMYIETIPKKGYIFLPSCTFVSNKIECIPRNKVVMVSSLLLFIVLIAFFINVNSKNPINVLAVTPFTSNSGIEYEISSDLTEENITYIHKNGSNYQLVMKNIQTKKVIVLIDDQWSKTSPKWLNRETIIFNRCKDKQCQIIKYSLNGTQEIIHSTIHQLSQSEIINTQTPQLVFSEIKKGNPFELLSLDLQTRNITLLKEQIKELPDVSVSPIYSKTANTLFLIGYNVLTPTIYAFNLDSGEKVFSYSNFQRVRTIARGFNDNELVISGTSSETTGIWLLNTETHTLDLLLRKSGVEVIAEAIALKSSNTIYYSIHSTNTDIVELSKDGTVNFLPKLNSSSSDVNAIYARNTNDIYFISTRSNFRDLWFYNSAKETFRQITHVNADSMLRPIVSHDSKSIALVYRKKDLYLIIIDAVTGTIMSRTTLSELVYPINWSLDDRFIYATEIWNENNLIQYNVNTFEKKHIRNNSGVIASESPVDGSLITFDYELNKLISIAHDGTTTPLTDYLPNTKNIYAGQMLLKDKSVIVATQYEEKVQVYEYPFISQRSTLPSTPSIKLNYDNEYSWVYSINPTTRNILAEKKEALNSIIMQMKLNF